jgi:lipoyltransferase 1
MAFMQKNFKTIIPKLNQIARNHCTGGHIEKSVFISQSSDIHTNMALEEWISKNYDFNNHQIMLFYKNDPCIVLAKNGNPWLETNVVTHPDEENHVALARRSATSNLNHALYQDQGSANVTFFGCADHFNKEQNMTLLKRGLFRKFGLKSQAGEDKLNYGNMTISKSGTTAVEKVAYQSCSLFVDINKANAAHALQKEKLPARKANMLNINEINPTITSDSILSAVGWEFLRTKSYSLKDGGEELASRQRGFQMINPTEKWFPGITEIRSNLANWEWCYGNTPNFDITHSFSIPTQYLNSDSNPTSELRISVHVKHGKIDDITLFVPPGFTRSGFSGEAKVITELRGQKFTDSTLKTIENILNGTTVEPERFVTECVKCAISSV